MFFISQRASADYTLHLSVPSALSPRTLPDASPQQEAAYLKEVEALLKLPDRFQEAEGILRRRGRENGYTPTPKMKAADKLCEEFYNCPDYYGMDEDFFLAAFFPPADLIGCALEITGSQEMTDTFFRMCEAIKAIVKDTPVGPDSNDDETDKARLDKMRIIAAGYPKHWLAKNIVRWERYRKGKSLINKDNAAAEKEFKAAVPFRNAALYLEKIYSVSGQRRK